MDNDAVAVRLILHWAIALIKKKNQLSRIQTQKKMFARYSAAIHSFKGWTSSDDEESI